MIRSIYRIAGALALVALFTLGATQAAMAATSGGATIYNTVKVTYSSGTGPALFAFDSVSITVETIPAAPTVTYPAGQTVIAGAVPTYNYILKSNSNGLDTYTNDNLNNAPTDVAAATGPSVTASVQLWGGIALGSGVGTITVPFGSTTGLVAGTSIVQIGATNQYAVTTITAGSAASTDASGNLVAESPTTLTLTPVAPAPAITAGSITAGTQVGEVKSITAVFTAGAPSTAGTDGTYSTTFDISTTATPVATFTTTGVTTTVSSPSLTIEKTADTTTARTGDVITYTITVTNNHVSAAVSNVTLIDPVPAYTTYVANSTRLNTITVTGDGGTSPLTAGLLIDADAGRSAGVAASGTLTAGQVATIEFQVTVQ